MMKFSTAYKICSFLIFSFIGLKSFSQIPFDQNDRTDSAKRTCKLVFDGYKFSGTITVIGPDTTSFLKKQLQQDKIPDWLGLNVNLYKKHQVITLPAFQIEKEKKDNTILIQYPLHDNFLRLDDGDTMSIFCPYPMDTLIMINTNKDLLIISSKEPDILKHDSMVFVLNERHVKFELSPELYFITHYKGTEIISKQKAESWFQSADSFSSQILIPIYCSLLWIIFYLILFKYQQYIITFAPDIMKPILRNVDFFIILSFLLAITSIIDWVGTITEEQSASLSFRYIVTGVILIAILISTAISNKYHFVRKPFSNLITYLSIAILIYFTCLLLFVAGDYILNSKTFVFSIQDYSRLMFHSRKLLFLSYLVIALIIFKGIRFLSFSILFPIIFSLLILQTFAGYTLIMHKGISSSTSFQFCGAINSISDIINTLPIVTLLSIVYSNKIAAPTRNWVTLIRYTFLLAVCAYTNLIVGSPLLLRPFLPLLLLLFLSLILKNNAVIQRVLHVAWRNKYGLTIENPKQLVRSTFDNEANAMFGITISVILAAFLFVFFLNDFFQGITSETPLFQIIYGVFAFFCPFALGGFIIGYFSPILSFSNRMIKGFSLGLSFFLVQLFTSLFFIQPLTPNLWIILFCKQVLVFTITGAMLDIRSLRKAYGISFSYKILLDYWGWSSMAPIGVTIMMFLLEKLLQKFWGFL